ncbi:MAG: rhodanese-like domain-containing protein [Crocinitomicaceae bacterium]
MRRILSLFTVLLFSFGFGQNPEGFEKMLKRELAESIRFVTPAQLQVKLSQQSSLLLLDTRQKKEYVISHIPGARHVEYDAFHPDQLKDIPKEKVIYLYCSIGYRSEKVGEKLEQQGYTNVYNLYGGIFNWVNQGYAVEDAKGKVAKRIHGYSKEWAKWVNKDRIKIILN